jgi:hypothetical protein
MAVVVTNGNGAAQLLLYVPMHLMQRGFHVVFKDWNTRCVRKVSLSSVGLYTLYFGTNDSDREDRYTPVKYEHGAVLPCWVDLEEWEMFLREKWLCPY